MTEHDLLEGKPRCHCGIFGIFNHPNAAVMTYYGLHALQHRGQEATGIVTSDFDLVKRKPKFHTHKGVGLVADLLRSLQRYTRWCECSDGRTGRVSAQPISVSMSGTKKSSNLALAEFTC